MAVGSGRRGHLPSSARHRERFRLDPSRGWALETAELGQLFKTCIDESTPACRRDAAMLAILYGTGMRRAELAGLDVAVFRDGFESGDTSFWWVTIPGI